ncbi:MAG: hypothetical protein JEY99_04410 [Spirochaetales bacterium]|nr:hypothetical protein [Spirochaetales bacterium]
MKLKELTITLLSLMLLFGCSDMMVNLRPHDLLEPGTEVTLSTSDGSTASTITAVVVDIDADGGVDGLDLDDNPDTVELPIRLTAVPRLYAVDLDGDGLEDFYFAVTEGVSLINTKIDQTGTPVVTMVDGSGDVTGLDLDDDNSTDLLIPDTSDSVLSSGEMILIPLGGSESGEVLRGYVVDVNGDGTADGVSLSGDYLPEILISSSTPGSYGLDPDGDGTADFYFVVDPATGGVTVNTAGDGSGTEVILLPGADPDSPGGWDTNGDGSADVEMPDGNDQVLTSGEYVYVPGRDPSGGLEPLKGLVSGGTISFPGTSAAEIPLGEGSGGYYPADVNGDDIPDFYVFVPGEGKDIIITSSPSGTSTDIWVLTGGGGFDSDGDGSADDVTVAGDSDDTGGDDTGGDDTGGDDTGGDTDTGTGVSFSSTTGGYEVRGNSLETNFVIPPPITESLLSE